MHIRVGLNDRIVNVKRRRPRTQSAAAAELLNGIFTTAVLIISICCCCDAASASGSKRQKNSTPAYKLPEHLLPRQYQLQILTNLDEDKFNFEGKVLIKLQCVKSTNKIVLHSKNLEITEKEVSVRQISTIANKAANETAVASSFEMPIASHQYGKENDFYIITLNESRLQPEGQYLLHIPFKGVLNEGLAGYYRSSYLDRGSNKTKWLSVTQFESTDARRAFPCFDEPAMKATFAISLGHVKSLKAISNMPLLESRKLEGRNDDWVLDVFQETVPMSTYLVAFMLSEFEYTEADSTAVNSTSNVDFRIWARKEALGQTELAMQVGPKVLAYFANYFNIEYPLPKQDMAAIPDFSAGAMENWGLITYRETALLHDPQTSSIFSKYMVASVISHELAHQWFGNLVTMKWWTDLWLNEGFATYVGELGVNHVFPEWKSLDAAAVSDLLTVLALDSLKSSHPVSVPIGNPSDIEQIFDTISYKKGSFLLRMLNMFLGEQVFRRSVTNYLKKHKYNNAAQDDLWDALTQVAHEVGVLNSETTVKMIMDSWTLQTGYPLVTVNRNYENGTITVSQERFLSSPVVAAAATENKTNKNERVTTEPCWWVPLSYTNSKLMDFTETKPKQWLTCRSGPLVMRNGGSGRNDKDNWILFNVKAAGLYRINYDQENWRLIRKTLNDAKEYSKIDQLNRVQIIADTLELASVGKLDYKDAFALVAYLQHESEYLPWRTALHSLNEINQLLLRTSAFGYFKKFLREMLEPVYKSKFTRGGITDLPKDFEGIKHHSLLVSWSCHYGVSDCSEQTTNLFKKWYSQSNPDANNPIPKNLRGVVYCEALKNSGTGEKYWEFLWQRYEKSNVASEQQLILESLGCVKELWLLQRYLKWSIDPTKIRKQDSTTVFASVAHNEIGYSLAKEFLIKRFNDIRIYHSVKSSRLGRYVKVIATQITSPEELDEFQSFTSSASVSSHLKDSELSLKQGIETATNNIAWHRMHFDTLSRYLLRK